MACNNTTRGGTAASLCESSRPSFQASHGATSSTTPLSLEANERLIHLTERTPLLCSCKTSSSSAIISDEFMEKGRRSRLARFVDKLAVESEPGLTNGQLMLANRDLKPVEPERRQCRSI